MYSTMKTRIDQLTRGCVIALLGLIFLAAALPSVPASADGPNRVGLVVQFPDHVFTTCITFNESKISGYDVLARSGLELSIDASSSYGVAVCGINGVGCSFPAEDCFCQCQGAHCVYWSYWHLKNGQWEYSQLGASNYFVQDGDVEGWYWGEGELNMTANPPPVFTFDALCAPPTPTPTSTPTATPTSTPVPLQVDFSVDDSTIDEGECTYLRWKVQGAQALYLDGNPVGSSGTRKVCPTKSMSYRLQIVLAQGAQERLVSVDVRPATPTPTHTPTPTATWSWFHKATRTPTPTPQTAHPATPSTSGTVPTPTWTPSPTATPTP
ncbi:MAG: hypothetical protein J7M34_05655, partial [Anaerolineae bacterium]|nr:hypothetical protein [Anaerolineae bacterium]